MQLYKCQWEADTQFLYKLTSSQWELIGADLEVFDMVKPLTEREEAKEITEDEWGFETIICYYTDGAEGEVN